MTTDRLAEPMFHPDCYDDRLSPLGNELAHQRFEEHAEIRQQAVKALLKLFVWYTVLKGAQEVETKIERKEPRADSWWGRTKQVVKEVFV